MDHISVLKNTGEGHTCLLMGNGPSMKHYDAYKIPSNVIRIGMGITRKVCDYIFYYDTGPMMHYLSSQIHPATRLVGFRSGKMDHTCPRCNYYFTAEDVKFGDTGFHTLQIADQIMNFSEIFLLGYDYRVEGKSYHFEEEESDPESMRRFLIHSCGETEGRKMPRHWKPVIEKYNDIPWKNKIYNCCNTSALKAFKFKSII